MKPIAICLLAGGAMSLGACDAFSESYNKNFDSSFREECLKAAVEQGAPEGIASKLCECTMDKLQAENGDGEMLFPSEQEQLAAAKACMAEST